MCPPIVCTYAKLFSVVNITYCTKHTRVHDVVYHELYSGTDKTQGPN